MGGKVVQLVQGREKGARRGRADGDAAEIFGISGNSGDRSGCGDGHAGENGAIVELLASRARCRVGGGVQKRGSGARALIAAGAHRVIIGTAAFTPAIEEITAAVGPERILIALRFERGGKRGGQRHGARRPR